MYQGCFLSDDEDDATHRHAQHPERAFVYHISLTQEKIKIQFLLNVLGEAHCLKPPTLARHHSNHLHELFYGRRS